MEIGAKIIVSGVVQGVGFRYYVFKYAINLGLNGIVRNLLDGKVEIAVEGQRSLIEELIKVIKIGPQLSDVTDVSINWTKATNNYNNFKIT